MAAVSIHYRRPGRYSRCLFRRKNSILQDTRSTSPRTLPPSAACFPDAFLWQTICPCSTCRWKRAQAQRPTRNLVRAP